MTDSPVNGARRKRVTPYERNRAWLVVGIVVILIAIAMAFLWPSISGGWNKFWNDPAKREQVEHVPIGDISIELTKTPQPRVQLPPPAQAVASAPTEVAMAPEAMPQTPAAVRSRAMSPYKGFWYEANLTPERLAKLVEDALLRDPTGKQLIDEAKCARDGSCASPMNYLEAARVYDPQARLEHVSELPKYFRSLVLDCTIKGRFTMADIFKPQTGPMMGRTDTSRMSRFIGPAECVFKNPRTGQPIIAQFCANPVGKRVAPPPPPKDPCPRYEQQVQKGDFVVVKIKGPAWQKKGCEPRVRIAGTSTWVPPHTLPACLRAFGLNCELGGNARYQFAYEALGDGTTVLELPAIVAEDGSGYEIVTCNVRLKQGSCGVITKPKHFRFDARRATKVATVYDKGRIPKDLARSHWDQTWRNGFDNCPVRPG